MLVIVKDWDFHAFTQLALNIKTIGRFNVFQVNAAKGRLKRRNDLDQSIRIKLVDFNVKHINARKLFKEHRLAFHDWLGGQRADIAKPQHRGAVGDHANQIPPGGVAKGIHGIRHDFFTCRRHPG